MGTGLNANQGAVWRDVEDYMGRTRTVSPTSALSDAFAERSKVVEDKLGRVPVAPGQIGFAAVRGTTLVGLDVFGSPELYAKGWRKAARGVLAEVHDAPAQAADPVQVVRKALDEASNAPMARQQIEGCGETLHGTSGIYVLGAVVDKGHVYHAVVAQTA
jgi:hypothetical protein